MPLPMPAKERFTIGVELENRLSVCHAAKGEQQRRATAGSRCDGHCSNVRPGRKITGSWDSWFRAGAAVVARSWG